MKRRNFLRSMSAASAPFMLGGVPIGLAKPMGFSNLLNGDSDRILVLIQLTGGNDGLNTIIQLDNYDNLANLRSNIFIPENEVIQLTDTHGLHPSMTGIRNLFDSGLVQIVQNVGYANQNRSHFRSTDIWTSGSASDEFVDTGWMGRYFAEQHPEYPDNFPNSDCPDPLALTLGNFVSETCQGTTANFSIAVGSIDDIGGVDAPGSNELPDNCYGHEMEFLIESIEKTNAYAERLQEAADNGSNASSLYNGSDRFAQQMMTTAQLISGGLQTKVYIVSLGGFDTHADQVSDEGPTTGQHAELWQSVSDAVEAFFDDMMLQGFGDKVLCMTFSEFGRQIKSNASLGTDHGTAAPLLVFGHCVNGGIIGDNIEIPSQVEPQAGVPMQYDFRDVYGTILEKWFKSDVNSIKNLLHPEYTSLNIFSDGCLFSGTEETSITGSELRLWPNPADSVLKVTLERDDIEPLIIEIYNPVGGLVYRTDAHGPTSKIYVGRLSAGQYVVRMHTSHGFVVKPFIKI